MSICFKIYKNGTKRWYLNGKLHRLDGPAVELLTGTKRWYLNGKHHREDGPAVELSTGTKEWYLVGKCIGENDKGFWEFLDSISEDKKKNPKLLEYYPESAIRKFSFSQNF